MPEKSKFAIEDIGANEYEAMGPGNPYTDKGMGKHPNRGQERSSKKPVPKKYIPERPDSAMVHAEDGVIFSYNEIR